ncbi:uncharacterized protein isoform X2 [Leptinotarsa decemlineata]|uniref:uncharacterized protein isoform X2 n=1 Tax=Leptinotarsa decemlineata TaxID=7539 RepID=UPI003D30D5AC
MDLSIAGVIFSLIISVVYSAPGYDLNELDLYHSPLLKAAPILTTPIIKEPLHLAPAPVYAPEPIYAPAPVIKAAPVIAPAPVIKTVAVPVVKTVVPATSYASFTQYHVAHPAAVVKTVVAPAPILKSYIASPLSYGHGYH